MKNTINHQVKITMRDHSSHVIVCAEDEHILNVMIDEDLDVPYGCTNGVCGKCKVRLISGEVVQDEQIGLEDDDIKANYILACQSRPLSDVELSYKND